MMHPELNDIKFNSYKYVDILKKNYANEKNMQDFYIAEIGRIQEHRKTALDIIGIQNPLQLEILLQLLRTGNVARLGGRVIGVSARIKGGTIQYKMSKLLLGSPELEHNLKRLDAVLELLI